MKNTEKWFGDLLESYKDDFEFRLETLVFELTEQISKKLKEEKISRKQFAEKLNVTPAAVSKILNGNPNFTLSTLLAMADALKMELSIELKRKEISSPEVKRVATTAEDAQVETKRLFETSDLADTPPAWMLTNITSAANC
ncbi:MAG TPA: helix-turn-helix transcriptional regulator [Smithella sp.]|jgi:transcriptional regulator with XRE-family HTH domain|nr:helix-turn-helix transcriptional regulator [Smithella sp.]HOS15285.1 helix-turn-helix transcriptional regulator [Smithella sp.]HPL48528.1 helix-turn-helix transcriptional regulator [Smithella sp.]